MASVHVYQTKKGKRYFVSYLDSETRKSTKERGFTRKDDAQARAEEIEVSKRAGTHIRKTAGHVTVGELGPEWFSRRGHIKPSTRRPEEISWRNQVMPRWGDVRVSDVRRTTIQAWVTEMSAGKEATAKEAKAKGIKPGKDGKRWIVPPKSPTTVIRAHGILAAILDDAVSDRLILENPARGVNLPRRTKSAKQYLTHDQVEALAASAGTDNEQYGAMVRVLAYTGLRWGELTGLRVRHVNFLRRRLSIDENAVQVGSVVEVGTPKTHERRTVPFPEFLRPILESACEGKGRDALVFASVQRPGEHMRLSEATKAGLWWERAVKRSGVPRVTPHELRHTAASLAVASGANVKAVQRMLGHASAVMTLDTYADLFDDDLDAVADRMGEARLAAIGS